MLSGLFIAGSLTAAAAGLHLDAASPPELEQVPDGPDLLHFSSRGVTYEVLDRVVVTLEPDLPVPPAVAAGRALGRSQRSFLVELPPGSELVDFTLELAQLPGVSAAFPDHLIRTAPAEVSFDDPRYGGQWYLDFLEAELAFAHSLGDAAVRIAVFDSGIEIDHPDLAAGMADPYDAFSDDDDPSPDPGEYCYDGSDDICDGHGTSVSGIIGARANNGEGIVGLCPECTLIPVKLLGEGSGTSSSVVAAFEHAIDVDAWVINNSWGYTTSRPVPGPVASVIERAATEPRDGLGAVVVFAAGNDDREIADDEMQALDSVICVTATDRYALPTAYTNTGASVDLSAPSATVTTDAGGGYTETFGGTSAAAPVVAGIAGWLLSQDPTLSAAEVRSLLIATAEPIPTVTYDDEGHHETYGYGQVSIPGLVEALYPTDTADTAVGVPQQSCGCDGSEANIAWLAPLLALALRRRRTHQSISPMSQV